MANLLHEWLPSVIQGIDPWISTRSIYAGDYWHREITENLRASNIGIVIVTRANQESAWLNYEAGALAQSVTTREGAVMPLLVGMAVGDLSGPMRNLQVNLLDQSGVRNILVVVNEHARPKLAERMLDREFNLKWPELESEVAQAIAELGSDPLVPPNPTSPAAELAVEFVGKARIFHSDESLIESYIRDRKAELFGDFPNAGSPISLIASPGKAEDRDSGEFRREVEGWSSDVRESWDDAIDKLAGAVWEAVTIKIENLTSRFLERLQVVVTLPGPVDAVDSLAFDDFDFEEQLPEKPRAWGPSPYMAMFTPPLVDISGMARPHDGTAVGWRRVGDALELTVDLRELRPKGRVECADEVVLIFRSDRTDDIQPIAGTWSATVRNLHEVIEGECTVSVEPKVYDFTGGLRKMLDV